MKEFLEKRYNCKVIDYFQSWYWSFRFKGHFFCLVLAFPQPCGSKSGFDYYTLRCDNKILVRKARLETCLDVIDKI